MTVDGYLRTHDLAQAVQISVQQVRNYEASGFIPIAERSASGYRRYTQQHLEALRTSRLLIGGYGWQRTQRVMRAVHDRKLADALALIDERHAELARTRVQLEQTMATLNLLAAQLPSRGHSRFSEGVRVGAAARMVGVRVSTLRFWEQQELLHPVRDRDSNYRLYDERQLRRLQIVTLLRQANHDFASIRATLDELEGGKPQRVVAAVEQRRNELAATSWRCVEGVASLHAYASRFGYGPG
jgi:DNA-binding transcriptional MerR regulator